MRAVHGQEWSHQNNTEPVSSPGDQGSRAGSRRLSVPTDGRASCHPSGVTPDSLAASCPPRPAIERLSACVRVCVGGCEWVLLKNLCSCQSSLLSEDQVSRRHLSPLIRPHLVAHPPSILIPVFACVGVTAMSRYRDNCPLDCKVYVGELGNNGTRHELEEAFGYYGPLKVRMSC